MIEGYDMQIIGAVAPAMIASIRSSSAAFGLVFAGVKTTPIDSIVRRLRISMSSYSWGVSRMTRRVFGNRIVRAMILSALDASSRPSSVLPRRLTTASLQRSSSLRPILPMSAFSVCYLFGNGHTGEHRGVVCVTSLTALRDHARALIRCCQTSIETPAAPPLHGDSLCQTASPGSRRLPPRFCE